MAAEGAAVVPHVHITPMRASRALALRFLATKFGLGMDAFTVMAVAPSMDTAGDATRVPAHTSDLIELVSGVCEARSALTLTLPTLPRLELVERVASARAARAPSLPAPALPRAAAPATGRPQRATRQRADRGRRGPRCGAGRALRQGGQGARTPTLRAAAGRRWS